MRKIILLPTSTSRKLMQKRRNTVVEVMEENVFSVRQFTTKVNLRERSLFMEVDFLMLSASKHPQKYDFHYLSLQNVVKCVFIELQEMLEDDDFKRTIYVGNLVEGVNEQSIFAFFSTFGEIKSIQIPIDHVTEKQRGFAFVQFDEIEEATAAIDNYDQTDFMDRTIHVKRSKPMHLKPNYHVPVWHNDNWLTGIENKKLQNDQYTKDLEQRNRESGLPIFKNAEKKDAQKPMVFNQEDD